MENFKLDNTDIIIMDEGEGKGKIIVSDPWMGSFSTYWGAMNATMKEFICNIDKYYFTDKMLGSSSGREFSPKLTMRAVRRHIRMEMNYELPWYKYRESQKELRKRLRDIETHDSQESFVSLMYSLNDDVFNWEDNRNDEKDFQSALELLSIEPWHFIETEPTRTAIWLQNLHTKLKKQFESEMVSA